MNVKKAINSIAEGDSLISIVANDSLKTSEGIVQFSHMIADQYNVGCGSSMAIKMCTVQLFLQLLILYEFLPPLL